MKLKRISPTKIEIESETPIYAMGDKDAILVAKQPISSFQAYFKTPKKPKGSKPERKKCFSCSRKAVGVVNSCSPTSTSGMTEPRPRCAYCLLSIRGGVNVLKWLVPLEEVKEELEKAIEYASDRIGHNVNVEDNKRVMERGNERIRQIEYGTRGGRL